MVAFLAICLICTAVFVFSMLAFDDVDLGDALDFGDDSGVSWFSLRALLLFGVGFGAVGALMDSMGYSTMQASLGGVGGGVLGYLLGIGIAVMLVRQQSNSQSTLADLIGKEGIVVVPIPKSGFGEVQVGALRAGAFADKALETGAKVVVVSSPGWYFEVKEKA